MGKSGPETTTNYQRQSLPGWWESTVWPEEMWLQKYALPGATPYNQPRTAGMSPYEQGGLNMYSQALGSMFGMSPTGYGGGYLANPAAPQSPDWYSLTNSPYSGSTLGNVTPENWNQPGGPGMLAPAEGGGGGQGYVAGGGLEGLFSKGGLSSAYGGGGGMGGLFGESQSALGRYLSPSFLNVAEDPYMQAALERTMGDTRNQFAQAGLEYGTSSADAQMRASSDLFLNELARRQQMQSGLAQFGTEFPMQALQGYQSWAGLPRGLEQQNLNAAYQEFLRQQEQGRSDIMGLWNQGMGMAGQPAATSQTTTPGGSPLGTIGQLMNIYLMGQGIPKLGIPGLW